MSLGSQIARGASRDVLSVCIALAWFETKCSFQARATYTLVVVTRRGHETWWASEEDDTGECQECPLQNKDDSTCDCEAVKKANLISYMWTKYSSRISGLWSKCVAACVCVCVFELFSGVWSQCGPMCFWVFELRKHLKTVRKHFLKKKHAFEF